MSSGLGFAAGGAAKGFGTGLEEGQSLQQGQASTTLGSAARLLSGAPPASDQGGGGPAGALSNIFQSQAPSAQSTAPQAAPSQVASGVARSPMSQQSQLPQGPAQAPPQAPAQPIPQAQPIPRAQPAQTTPVPVPGLAPAQPGIANTGAQQGQQQAPPTPPPQAQALPQPAPNIPRQPPMAPPQPGQFDLPNLTKAIIQANPKISDKQLGNALTRAIPLLNAQGLQQYRSAAEQIRRDQVGLSGERVGIEGSRERRLAGEAGAKPQRDLATKQAAEMLAVAGREYSAVANDPNADPKAKAAAEAKYEEAKKQAQGILSKGYGSQDEGGGESANPIIYDDKGRAMRYKGDGDPKDPGNYAPVQ